MLAHSSQGWAGCRGLGCSCTRVSEGRAFTLICAFAQGNCICTRAAFALCVHKEHLHEESAFAQGLLLH